MPILLASSLAAHPASGLRSSSRELREESLRGFYFCIRVLVCVVMTMLADRSRWRSFCFLFSTRRFYLRRENLLAPIHSRRFINAVRQAEVAAFFILNNLYGYERVVRPAVAGVTIRVAHAD